MPLGMGSWWLVLEVGCLEVGCLEVGFHVRTR